MFKDNRDFVGALQKTGDAVRVSREVDWDLEAAAVTGRSCEMKGPACLFERLKDYPEGGRILGAPVATYRRLAIAMGLGPDTPMREVFQEFERRLSRPVKPVAVKAASCKENKLFGDDVDLYRFPIPTVHEGDGGRYIGTWHCVINQDPETGWTNWGMYRLMVFNRRLITGYLKPYSHFGLIQEKYKQAGKPMPVSVAIGADPLCAIVAASPVGIGEDEADFAGALAQSPIELVKCETNDLLVPAHAEIILEGEILRDVELPEGPFGEFPGFRTQGWAPGSAFKIKAITYRSNPILCLSPEGVGISDGKIGPSIAGAIGIKNRLKRYGVPVVDVYIPPEMGALVAVVSVKESNREIVSQIAGVIHGRRTSVPKVIIVNDDVDVFNLDEVMHAMGTRLHPIRGVSADPDKQGWTLVPYLSPEERSKGRLATGIYDCTWPAEWTKESDIPVRMSFQNAYPEALQKKIIAEWKQYGF
ncbi:MAG: UbiD family decarboxylase [Candidatus Tectomicrobia bacterium]|uniref:UbiD family decarboxylase n=1 Tax=Tectimicrobiota bacterium TaxID=2528274 RepID=A0A932GS15_UNCTE|nr:UbiD family decarboxylase [Candidatus Tectomicrobia bacterium]